MKIEHIQIKELKPAVYNPRKWDQKIISDMTESIKRFGLCDPLIVNGASTRKNILIGGSPFRFSIVIVFCTFHSMLGWLPSKS